MVFLRKLGVISLLLALAACGGGNNPGGGGNTGGATTIQSEPNYLSFAGTSSTTVSVTANGSWTAQSDQSWISVSPSSGSGNTTVTVTINRTSLTPGHYAGSVLLKGSSAREVVTVYMRFPNASGNITGPSGQIKAGSLDMKSLSLEPSSYVPGEVLVMLEPGMVALSQGISLQGGSQKSPDVSVHALRVAANSLAAEYGLAVKSVLSPELPIFSLSTEGKPVGTVLEALQHDGRIHFAQPNYIVNLLATPNDTQYSAQWHYPRIRLPQAWELTKGSSEIVVAVVDSGIDPSHPDLVANTVPGYNFFTNSATLSDTSGHGTHVAGTIAAVTNNNSGVAGVGWNTKVMPIRVFNDSGSATDLDVNRGILFGAGLCVYNSAGAQVCPAQKAKVINLSLGPNNPSCVNIANSDAHKLTIAFALGNDVTVVAAAGNDNCSIITGPAGEAGVIAVSATGPTDIITLYSNFGSKVWLAAPGGDQSSPYGTTGGVYSTLSGGSYGYLQGTSMASPHVAGVAALALAANPNLSPTYVRLLLRDTATDLGTAGWDQFYGYGLVNAEAAVQAARNLLTAYNSDFYVRLKQGNTLVKEVRADAGGNFTLENLPSGNYTLESGNDRNKNGVLGDPGEFYGMTNVTIGYDGDTASVGLNVQPR